MRIIIVGGGTAGWLTAAACKHELRHADITLIDKEMSDPVAVGEATLQGFEKFLKEKCGFNPREYITELDVGLKGGILFPDWGFKGSKIWHPFYFFNYPFFSPDNTEIPMVDAWSHCQDIDFKKLTVLWQTSMENYVDRTQIENAYALHVDCLKLTKFIRKKILNDITFINSEVKDIKRDLDGNITSLMLANGGKVQGDLFIDCTGFKGLLRDDKDRVDLTDRLYVDTALAGHIPYRNRPKEFKPYVTCPAVNSGWIWDIPLQSRVGSGLVFNRNITPPEEAASEFCKYWNNRVTPDDLKLIDWTPYYEKTQWKGNVISIGLSAGFIEPLESTGVALTMEGIATICRMLKPGTYDKHDADYFNSRMKLLFNICIDFVNMHYSKSDIDSPFWEYVRENYKMSDAQKTYIDNMNSPHMSLMDGKDFIFGGANWVNWMIQMGYDIMPKDYMNFVDKDILKKALENLIDIEDKKVSFAEHINVHLVPNNQFCDHFLV